MKQSSCFTVLLVVVSFASSKIVNRPKFSNYHVPWACSVVYTDGSLIGACAIFDANKVLVSVDNFNQDVMVKGTVKKYYEVVTDILVYAGSNLMDPESLKPWAAPAYQVKRGVSLHVPTGRKNGKWSHKSTPDLKDLSRDSVEYDHYGVAFNVGFMLLKDSFSFHSHVQPILILSNIAKETDSYIKAHESNLIQSDDTCITYSWSKNANKIRYHEVMYLRRDDCLDLFCMWNLTTCDWFPKQTYQACFKSVTYVDVCPSARGAALYCPSFSKSIFAILTTAPSCGRRHMPGVYTTLPLVIELYEAIFGIPLDLDERPKYDPLGQRQPYSPFG